MNEPTKAREYAKGIGAAVADRSINRKVVVDGVERSETWDEVAKRVATGNAMLVENGINTEFKPLYSAIRSGVVLMSGRHLQHGDETQPERNIEVFTNCSTSAMSFLTFYLLLNGSGVGRAYDDEMMVVDWTQQPIVMPVIDPWHPDVLSGEISAIDRRTALHLAGDASNIIEFKVPDSREGWTQAIEKMEICTFHGSKDSVLILDFSDVRFRGSPIKGMQDRPASGPGPLIDAIQNISKIRGQKMQRWRAAMYVDHYLAECVLVGGARRAARMATKDWRDKNVVDFVQVKRPIEFIGKSGDEIAEIRKGDGFYSSFLWSSNNSVTVDQQFWRYVKEGSFDGNVELCRHAREVLRVVTECAYFDGTGEPGFINQDKLVSKGEISADDDDWLGSDLYRIMEPTKPLAKAIAARFNNLEYQYIVNPCGEIVLSKLGGYCVIADVVPFHAASVEEAAAGFRAATRALIRTNTMTALYSKEVMRTNRIGVGMTGIHEYAYSHFGFNWHDLVNEEKSIDFWMTLAYFKRCVKSEAESYSKKLGVNTPHTDTTIKPAGTTSKLFSLSEGAHLPSMAEYLRWVQFRSDAPEIEFYRESGYPIRELKIYSGTTIVGFPTQPMICQLGMGEDLVTASEATPEEQYEWLRLLEKYWIVGVDEAGQPLSDDSGNQVSYTLKYDPKTVNYEKFRKTLIEGQSTIRCCSVMPMEDGSAYEYQPEQSITKHEFEAISEAIRKGDETPEEDIGLEHLDCEGGACPIDFKENKAS